MESEQWSYLIGIRLHRIISSHCCWDDYMFTFQFLDAAGVSMEIAQQKWRSRQEVRVPYPYFVFLHPMACTDGTRKNIQHT